MNREPSNASLVEFAPPESRLEPQSTSLDSRFEIHDDNQIELKLDYRIDSASKWTRYRTEAYIFVPKSLGVSRHSYDSNSFFSDIQGYIRFKTPQMSFRRMIDPEAADSPLTRLRALVESTAGDRFESGKGVLSQELRMFGCLLRANLRDTIAASCGRLESTERQTSEPDQRFLDLAQSIHQVVDDVDAACIAFRNLRPEFVGVRAPSWVRKQFECVDEFVSVTVESCLSELLHVLDRRRTRDKKKSREVTDSLWNRLVATITREQIYREQSGYVTCLQDKTGRSAYLNRIGALKKFVTSVLFLEMADRREGVTFLQVAAGIAAGIAMAFSLAAAFFSERVWGVNSIPFLVAVVLGYIFKDRIKDWAKAYFATRISRWLPDRSMEVIDPASGGSVGHCRESFAFLNNRQVPESVRRWRQASSVHAPANSEVQLESVLHYAKDVAVLGQRIADTHDQRLGINDIIRWNISRLMSRMDDPVREVEFYDRQKGNLQTVPCPKQYELNVVLVLSEPQRLVSVERYRVQLDRSGIHALELVAINGAATSGSKGRVAREAACTSTVQQLGRVLARG